MSLQPRTSAPGKARRAASAGKPKRTKKAATFKESAPKARHTTAQKAARKGAAAKPSTGKPASTRRYSDVDTTATSKKETRLVERSKLRAKRYQEQTASKPRPTEEPAERSARIERSQRPDSRAKKFVKEREVRESAPRPARPERTERTERPAARPEFKKTYKKAERPAFKREDSRPAFKKDSDTRPTNRRDAVKAKIARTDDGRPNFEPRKREKFDPTRPKKSSVAPDTRAANFRAERPVRDRRNDSPAYARDDFKKQAKSHSNAAVDFGADDNYISANLADANLVDATPLTEITTTFADLGIAAPLVNALSKQGILHPFPIQIATLPDALAGHDILGRGQTGSGKTLAFGLALLNNLNGKVAKPHKPLALVLTPTRELAQQIDEVLMPLARSIGHESVVVAGGMSYSKQITAMRRGTAILVATPGRLIDLLNKGEVQLDQLQITVLDEADQMADMGFLPVVKEILDQAKLDGQRLLFSATLDRGVDSLVRQYLKNPKTHSLQNDRASVSTMEHYVLVMNPTDKDDITNQVAARNGKTILFVKTQRGADRLADKLAHAGVPVGALHGGKSQAVRTRTLALFKETANAALVATDVAARGIHVDGISLVVHVDAPTDHKDYLHRAGRTARAGEAGTVVTLATTRQQKSIGGLTQRAGVTPKFVGVTPLSTELMKITGAQEPTGIPYIVPIVEKSVRSGGKRPRPNSSQRRRRPH
ncbi:MAG: DEAD/DEAH box helicase [Candidatus Planktophila sp.]|nr:DEAD/DEAH box helicase [Candidatus Planktophila sp.]